MDVEHRYPCVELMSNLNGFLKRDIGPLLQISRAQYVENHVVLPSLVYLLHYLSKGRNHVNTLVLIFGINYNNMFWDV
jgi:hypothetical protein